jgi:hypothetical protein
MEQFIEGFQHLYGIKPVKQLAPLMGASESLLYKWVETGEQHRTNPAEHMVALTRATGDFAVVDSVCHGLDGTFVPDPLARGPVPPDLSKARCALMLHLGEFVAAVARAVITGSISPSHARVVRQCWNKLKSAGEAFVRACERGTFQPSPRRAVLAHGHHPTLTQRRYN